MSMSILKRLGNLGRGWTRTLGSKGTRVPPISEPPQPTSRTHPHATPTVNTSPAETPPIDRPSDTSQDNLPPDEDPIVKRTL